MLHPRKYGRAVYKLDEKLKSVDSVNSSNPFLNEADVLIEKILTYSSLNKDKDTFPNLMEIANKNQTIFEVAIVENLSGNYEELDYYN